MNVYQFFLAVIASFFILMGILRFIRRERSQTLFKLFLTLFVWGGIFTISIFPNVSHTLSTLLGLGENLNTLIFIGFVVVFIIIFRLLNVIEKLEMNISEIVRKEALEKINDR